MAKTRNNGNSIHCQVTSDTIDANQVLSWMPSSSHGAESVFFGMVRDINFGRRVKAVSYDVFEPLAENIFRSLCEEARQKWGQDLRIYLVHRVGRLQVGQISVAIAVTSRHREEAYQASRYVIEQLKVRAPIWKKEYYEDGETEWVRGHALCQHGNKTV